MSKISKAVSQMNENNNLRKDEIVTNFMGGDSCKLNPLDTLKMIAASSIFGEASYYRSNVKDSKFESVDDEFSDEFYRSLFSFCNGKTTTEIFEEAIDNSLSYDFYGTLKLASELRTKYYMRLNPQIIMVRAAIHPDRKKFTKKFPGIFNKINQTVMKRADEPMSQLAYYLYLNDGKKNNIPSILKRSISEKLSLLKPYDVNKYKNHEIGMINAVRITHANSSVINELMENGFVSVEKSEMTWEQKRSAGMTWRETILSTDMGHMALLRNIKNVFKEVDDVCFCTDYTTRLQSGVLKGKQFPFRYWSAYNIIMKEENIHHKQIILDTLEECIDISIDNMPKIKGKTMCLSDNSGSAWECFNSEYGSVTVAEIDNLSSVIAARCSEEGYVGKFGDKLIIYPISKKNGVLSQCNDITKGRYRNVGGDTEGGIWEFFRDSIKNKEYYDNIFIFSDQQAGTGNLYGNSLQVIEYESKGYACSDNIYNIHRFLNVYKLILDYRKKVNPKVNVFSVQTGGYDNVVIPDMSYRCAMLTGWTGKEVQFASEYIRQWNSIENRR